VVWLLARPVRESLARGISVEMGNPISTRGGRRRREAAIGNGIRLLRKVSDPVELANASVQMANVLFTRGRWSDC
jgi:hypothetical protein